MFTTSRQRHRRRARRLLWPSLLAGCSSSEDEDAPAACLARRRRLYDRRCGRPPARSGCEGETPISDCLTPDQEGGQLATIGKEMIAAATELNAAAQKDPGGPEALQLGYLVGAVEKGSEGIHADLGRRLDTAARYSPDGLLPAEFERTFGPGYAAGLESRLDRVSRWQINSGALRPRRPSRTSSSPGSRCRRR